LAVFLSDSRPGVVLFAAATLLFGYTVREAKRLKARAAGGEFEHELAQEPASEDGRGTNAPERTD